MKRLGTWVIHALILSVDSFEILAQERDLPQLSLNAAVPHEKEEKEVGLEGADAIATYRNENN